MLNEFIFSIFSYLSEKLLYSSLLYGILILFLFEKISLFSTSKPNPKIFIRSKPIIQSRLSLGQTIKTILSSN